MNISLFPDWVLDNYGQVTPECLTRRGIRLLLTDLDFTLAPKSVRYANEEVRTWVAGLRAAGIRVIIISNNRNPARGPTFCDGLDVICIDHAGKPLRRSFLAAMEHAGVTPAQTVMLGDKLLTDVLGAHRTGLRVAMVEPKGGAITLWQKVLHGLQEPFKMVARRRQHEPF